MGLLRIYLRVLALLGPEKGLAAGLALANAALAAVFLIEPWLFGRVVDALDAQGRFGPDAQPGAPSRVPTEQAAFRDFA